MSKSLLMSKSLMMPKLFAFFILAMLTALLLAPIASAANIVGDKVVLRALDKVTATTEDYTVIVGNSLKYGSLEIKVQHCEKRPPEETPEVFAFLQITDALTDGHGGEREAVKLFSGWMFASSPALSALDHPVYDIWVLDCITTKRDGLTDAGKTRSENP